MSLTNYAEEEPRINPLDVVERLATGNDWSFERASDDEITILVTGRWTDYQLSYTWMSDIEALHLACAFDLRVPERRRTDVQTLISLINERLWVGHFDHWNTEGIIMFRHALVLAGGTEASGKQCEALLGTALEACERYFTAFQFVVWAGKGAREALDAAHVRKMEHVMSSRAAHTGGTDMTKEQQDIWHLIQAIDAIKAAWETDDLASAVREACEVSSTIAQEYPAP